MSYSFHQALTIRSIENATVKGSQEKPCKPPRRLAVPASERFSLPAAFVVLASAHLPCGEKGLSRCAARNKMSLLTKKLKEWSI